MTEVKLRAYSVAVPQNTQTVNPLAGKVMNNGYFDVKRDIAIVNPGGFFCQSCLVGKTANEMSFDSRYCQSS